MVSNESPSLPKESGDGFVFPKRKATKRKADSEDAMEIVNGVEGTAIPDVSFTCKCFSHQYSVCVCTYYVHAHTYSTYIILRMQWHKCQYVVQSVLGTVSPVLWHSKHVYLHIQW